MNEAEVISYVLKHFRYHNDGTLTRSDRKGSYGSYDKDGYLIIKIKGKQFKSHRLIYAMHNNKFPYDEIDHINGIRDDNRIENLRSVDRQGNVDNTRKKPNKDTGVVGVYIDRTNGLIKKYATKLSGRTYRFYSVEEAVQKRREHYGK